MGNEPLCGADTRPDYSQSQYLMCGREQEFRNSTTINIVNHVPIVTGQPLNFQKQQTFRKVEKSATQFCAENKLQSSFIPIVARIIAYGHTNIFKAYRRLPQSSKYDFLDELRFIDIDFMDLLYHRYVLGKRAPKTIAKSPNLVQYSQIPYQKLSQYEEAGRQCLQNNQVGFMMLCAGSSSRFMFQDKFLTPLEINSGQTLLQLLIERIRANLELSHGEQICVPVIFACNFHNRSLIENFLKSKKYCGLDPMKIRYIQVPMMPIMDQKGKLCMTFEFKIMEKPSGTLKCVQELLGSGVFQFLKSEGVAYLHIFGGENLAENPGDPLLAGYLIKNKLELVGKCTEALYETEDFPRYAGNKNGKTILVNTNQIVQAKLPANEVHKLITHCPIAMNSIFCRLSDLKSMVKSYDNSMFLTQEYEPIKKVETYFDFDKERPAVNHPVIVFEKDLGHLFTCTQKHHLLKVPRSQYLPILNRNGSYSMKQACKLFIENQNPSLKESRTSEY